MTRTEDELRTLLHALIEASAPDRVLQRVAAARRRPRAARRHLRIGLVTVAALVLVVVTVVAVRPSTPTGEPPVTVSPTAIPVDALVVGFDPDSGFGVDTVTLGRDGQDVTVTSRTDPDRRARASLAPAGGHRSDPLPDRGSLAVGDAVARWYSPYEPGALGGPQSDVLGWESGGFAFSVQGAGFGGEDATTVAVARAMRVVAPVPVLVPVAVSSWPSGLGLLGISTAGAGVSVTAGAHVSIRVFDTGIKGVDPARGTPAVIGDRTWRWDASIGVLTWGGPDRIVQVGPETYNEAQFVSESEIEELAAALTFASSFTDTSTWFDATTAFPH